MGWHAISGPGSISGRSSDPAATVTPVPVRWTADQVLATAPDAASVAAGRKLATPGPWSDTGVSAEPPALWGSCAGSGKTPYQTVIDLAGPAFKCSCPSRKFPCKHALGLLLLWSAGHVPEQDTPGDAAAAWLAARDDRATKAATRAEATPDPAAAASAARHGRAVSGPASRSSTGGSATRCGPGSPAPTAEATGASTPSPPAWSTPRHPGWPDRCDGSRRSPRRDDGWAGRLVEEYALLHLLTVGHHRIDDLPPALADTVRARVGYTVRVEDVVATPGLRDRWDVVGLRDGSDGRLTTRRVHVRGATTGRNAFVLSFAAGSQPLDSSLLPGHVDRRRPAPVPRLVPRTRCGRDPVRRPRAREPRRWRSPGRPGAQLGGGARRRPVAHRAARRPVGRPSASRENRGCWSTTTAPRCRVRRGDRPWPLLALSGGRPVTVWPWPRPRAWTSAASARTTGG